MAASDFQRWRTTARPTDLPRAEVGVIPANQHDLLITTEHDRGERVWCHGCVPPRGAHPCFPFIALPPILPVREVDTTCVPPGTDELRTSVAPSKSGPLLRVWHLQVNARIQNCWPQKSPRTEMAWSTLMTLNLDSRFHGNDGLQ